MYYWKEWLQGNKHVFLQPKRIVQVLILLAFINSFFLFYFSQTKNIIFTRSFEINELVKKTPSKREGISNNERTSRCGLYGSQLIFENTYIVLTYCFERIPIEPVERVASQYNVTVQYAKCNSTYGKIEANEVGTIFHWIIDNWSKIKNGSISKVIFHHAHEHSPHQEGNTLSRQLVKLFNAYSYFCGRDFGEVYPFYIEHELINETAFICAYNFIETLDTLTRGTSFAHFNRSNSKNTWRSGRNSAFFVSAKALTKNHKLSDYKKFLNNIHETVVNLDPKLTREKYRRSTNFYVGECVERAWYVLFTNQTYSDYQFPKSFGKFIIA